MQTTLHTANRSQADQTRKVSDPTIGTFRTREQHLFESDRPGWVQEQLEWPILNVFHQEAKSPARQDVASQLFFTHYLAFFREAELLCLPLIGEFLQDWLALGFESAFDFALRNEEIAASWLDEGRANRGFTERKFQAFTTLPWKPDFPAHVVVKEGLRCALFNERNIGEAEIEPLELINAVERSFWLGMFAATEARQNHDALDLVEWFDLRAKKQWDDGRHHTQLIRKAALRDNQTAADFLVHPLLRIADEKYKNSPLEAAAFRVLLEQLSLRYQIQSEHHCISRELEIAQWVRDARKWGAWLLRTYPTKVQEIICNTNALTGDSLTRFYKRVLGGVDKREPIEITLAFLSWQARVREHPVVRYHGERLETIVECVDAAAWLPWWLAQKKASR